MAGDARTLKVIEQQARQREGILLQVLKALLGLWGGFKGWDDPDLVSAQAARSATLVDVALSKTRTLSRSYAETVTRDLNVYDKKAFPPQVDLYPRSDTSMLDVYARPAEQYLWAISQGKTDAEAMKIALKRVEVLAAADLAAAERDELQMIWNLTPDIVGHRRIIHPELSASGTCGLCIVAATRFYSTDELLPLHNNCKCTSLPVVAGNDPGLRLNEADLKEIYAAAGSTAAEDLKNTRVTVKENGELGPILVREGAKFRDVTEVNKTGSGKTYTPYERPTKENQRATWEATIDRATETIANLKVQRDAGVAATGKGYAAAIKHHSDLIDRMKAKLR